MEIIVRNGSLYSLLSIPDNDLENNITCQDEVIESFSITEWERQYIEEWVIFTYDSWIVISQSEIDRINLIRTKQNKKAKLKELEVIQREAMQERLKWLTLDMFDEGTFKTDKKAKSDAKWLEIKGRYEAKMAELVTEFWEEILNDI